LLLFYLLVEIGEMSEQPDYYFLEDESVYSLIFSPVKMKDPVTFIQRLYDDDVVGCFVAFVELKEAKRVAELLLRRLPENFRAYILRIRFKEMVALFCLKTEYRQSQIQVFCPPKMLEGKFEIVELCTSMKASLAS